MDPFAASCQQEPEDHQDHKEAVVCLDAFLVLTGRPTEATLITKADLQEFIADQLARWTPATANNRYRALQRFWACLVAEEAKVFDHSPMLGVESPTIPEADVPVVAIEDLLRILDGCKGTTRRPQGPPPPLLRGPSLTH